eukprot:1868964-Rhodomonas_salina.2
MNDGVLPKSSDHTTSHARLAAADTDPLNRISPRRKLGKDIEHTNLSSDSAKRVITICTDLKTPVLLPLSALSAIVSHVADRGCGSLPIHESYEVRVIISMERLGA